MEDSRNKPRYKVMWLPGENVLWEVSNDQNINIPADLTGIVNSFIDLPKWAKEYEILYHKWLNDEDHSIFDIKSSVNLELIYALIEANKSLADKKVYYWFDRDRTRNENFDWKYCPLSFSKLCDIPEPRLKINSKFSSVFPLIFPGS